MSYLHIHFNSIHIYNDTITNNVQHLCIRISTEFTLGCCCPTQQRLWSPLQHKLSFLEAKCEKHNRIQKDKRTPNAFNRDVQWWGLNWVYFAECTQRSPFCFFFPMAAQRTSCAETLQKTHLTSARVSKGTRSTFTHVSFAAFWKIHILKLLGQWE